MFGLVCSTLHCPRVQVDLFRVCLNFFDSDKYSDIIYHSDQIFKLSLGMTITKSCDLPYMEYSDITCHSDQIFELSLEIIIIESCDLPYVKYNDVIYYFDQFLELSLKMTFT